jgi:outer membrane protein assembly factor BamB
MDGTLLWKVKTSGSTRFRLAQAHGIVYQNTPRGCCALDGSSGTLIWQVDTGARVSSPPLVLHGMVILCLSEAQYDHAHFLASGEMRQWHESFLCALAARDGVELWRVPLGVDQGTDHSLAASHSHRAIYVSTGEGTLAAFHAESGSPLWHYKTGGTLLSAPGEANGVVYVGANDGCVYALRASEGALLWRTFVSSAVTTVSAISAVSIHHLRTSNSQGQDNGLG